MTLTKSQFDSFKDSDRMNRTLEGEAYWAFIQKPKVSEKYKTSAFSICLGLDETNVAKAESYGLKVKPADKNVPMPYVEIKRKIKQGVSASDVKPAVVDSMQRPVPDGTLIGNKSKVIVKFGTYWHDAQGGGVGNTLFKVQIRDLVEFKPTDKGLIIDENGYQAAGSSSDFDE